MRLSVKILTNVLFLIRVFLTVTRPLSDRVLDFVSCILYGKSKQLPVIDHKILLMSATQLAKKIRKKELSAVEVMQVYVNRIKSVDPIVNACIDNRFEEAMADARAVDRMLEAGIKTEDELAQEMPLLGVPFTCKEEVGVKNLRSARGLKRFINYKATEDSDAAAQYRLAGAIPVAVTNIPIMCMWWDTSNPAFGTTKNPYDNKRIPGGSSGGEAALIASASTIIGIGSDLGGSIRIPSSFCGIYGHKPSKGIISTKIVAPEMPRDEAMKKVNIFNTIGPMCRYAEDLHLLVKVLSGNDKKLRLNEEVDFRTMKVYYMEELPGFLLSATSDIKSSVRKAVKHFEEEYGISPNKIKLEEMQHAVYLWCCKVFEVAGDFINEVISDENGRINLFWEYLRCFFGFSEYDYRVLYFAFTALQEKDKSYYNGLDMNNKLEKKLGELLEGNAILIMPVHCEPAPHTFVTIPKFDNIAYTCFANILGLPGTAVPTGLSKGLPIGLQIVANRNNDHLTLAAAVELDKVFGGWHNPCPVLL